METFICYACSKPFPVAFRDKHHKIPQAAGGTDADLVDLDSGCHQALHRVAKALLNPKRQQEAAQLIAVFQDEPTRQKIAELANWVAKEMVLKANGQKQIENERILITLEVDKEMHKQLLFAAKDRKMSMQNFILGIVRKTLGSIL